MNEPKIASIVYQSGVHPTQGWDQMQVIGKYEDGKIANSYVIARSADATIRRKTDIVYDWWEIVTDEDDLRIFRRHFADRDRLAATEAAKAAKA